MQGFLEIDFPVELTSGSTGGPEYHTSIMTSIGGTEYRNIDWSCQRMRFNIAPSIKNDMQMTKLITFFHVCRGKGLGFRFKDWRDYSANMEKLERISQPVINAQCTQNMSNMGESTINNDSTALTSKYQLYKHYSVNGTSYSRIINKPVRDTVEIIINGHSIPNEYYSVDHTNGVVTIDNTQIPSNDIAVYANYLFDVPVRFNVDYLESSIEAKGLYKLNDISLIELKI